MLSDLALQVNNVVFIYLKGSTTAFRGTLTSVDSAGVTKLSNDDSVTTTHYEVLSSEIVGFATQTTD